MDGPEDWEEVEKIVRKFIDSKKKIVRVIFCVKYTGKGVGDISEGGETDENSIMSGELENRRRSHIEGMQPASFSLYIILDSKSTKQLLI